MSPCAWVVAWVACVGHRIEAAPIALRDGQALERPGPVRVALVGGVHGVDQALLDRVRAYEPQIAVVTDGVDRGSAEAYRALHARLAGLPVVPVPGPHDARGDRRLRRWTAAWSGLGTAQTDQPSTWRAFDLVSDEHRWRVVLLDADQARLGDRFVEETFWLPRVVGGDAPLLIVVNGSVDPTGGPEPTDVGARELRELVLRHADVTRLVLVVSVTPESGLAFDLPGGPWGEGWLSLGASPGTWWSVELDGSTLRLRPVAEPGVGPPDENPGVHDATWAGTWAWTRDGGWTTP